jgi:hypothetical protein
LLAPSGWPAVAVHNEPPPPDRKHEQNETQKEEISKDTLSHEGHSPAPDPTPRNNEPQPTPALRPEPDNKKNSDDKKPEEKKPDTKKDEKKQEEKKPKENKEPPDAQAIDKGVAYLKQLQGNNGAWAYGQDDSSTVGSTALAGLTLLECGVAPDDPAVQKAAAFVRDRSIGLTKTYSLSLSIMFLDRLGDDRDANLIDSMALRLLAGQNMGNGAWSYECPGISAAEAGRLKQLLEQRNELVAGDLPKTAQHRQVKDLPKEIQAQLAQVQRAQATAPAADKAGGSDNSNTQFAILALWIARRQGMPVDDAFQHVDTHIRRSQNDDGGWSYMSNKGKPVTLGMGSTPSMTCAGLLGLAVSRGSANEAILRTEGKAKLLTDPGKDPAIKAGLVALGASLQSDPSQPQQLPMLNARTNGRGYYLLWSLERVAVAYGLDMISGKDWYGWGTGILLGNQRNDGSWQGEFPEGGVDTCFALLFLRRANIAPDLTAALQGKAQNP